MSIKCVNCVGFFVMVKGGKYEGGRVEKEGEGFAHVTCPPSKVKSIPILPSPAKYETDGLSDSVTEEEEDEETISTMAPSENTSFGDSEIDSDADSVELGSNSSKVSSNTQKKITALGLRKLGSKASSDYVKANGGNTPGLKKVTTYYDAYGKAILKAYYDSLKKSLGVKLPKPTSEYFLYDEPISKLEYQKLNKQGGHLLDFGLGAAILNKIWDITGEEPTKEMKKSMVELCNALFKKNPV